MLIKALFVSALILDVAGASSQESVIAGKPPGAVVAGVAIDSVHRTPLAGASISVSGTSLTSTTDYAGEFRIAGIPNGPHFLRIRHPLLDSLAIAITTKQRDFEDGDSAFVMVGVPSAPSLVSSTCSEDDRVNGPAFVVGTVTDADSGKPSAGASVIVQWTDYDIGTRTIKATPRIRSATVSETGRFRVCGLPSDLVATVFASRGGDSTAALKTDLSSLIGVLSFHLPPSRRAGEGKYIGPASIGAASITGHVIDSDGNPARDASISIDADSATAVSDKAGNFFLGGVRPGTRGLAVRKIGYEPRRAAVDLMSGAALQMNLVLGNSVTLLKDVIVKADRDRGLRSVGFTERRNYQTGEFLGPADLELKDHHDLMKILKTSSRYKRGGCTRFYVDGILVMPGVDPGEYLGGAEIGAIEIYSEEFVPGEFLARLANGRACKAVVVWSKGRLRL